MSITCTQCQHRNPKDAKFCKECGLRLARSSDPLIGQKIGNHRLVKRIGVGGMGVVYLAEHVNLGKKYAVKFLHPQFASDEEVVERFRREAQVIAGLDHENIIRENDFGWLDGVGFYLIMEYLEGDTLKDAIRQEGPLETERVLSLFAQLMDALDEAHSQSVIHRDLKPENIFLMQRRGREQLKILDFGIARIVMDGAHKDFTIDGEVYGSPTYMSPEQARGEISKVDHRADLYAVGIILVEVLTGRPPYQGATPAEVMLAHISGLPPRLSDLAPDLRFAGGLEDIVLKALAKEPDERFQSAAEFWAELEPMLLKTLELQQRETNETIDQRPVSRPPVIQSSAKVFVSREQTGTPTPSGDPPSQPSLHGAGSPVIRGDATPAPTAEMPGQSLTGVGTGSQPATPFPPEPIWSHEVSADSRTDLRQVMQHPSSEPTPATPSPAMPHHAQPRQEDSFPPSGHVPRPLSPPVEDVIAASLDTYAEDGDEDPTTVSFIGRSLPSTPPKSEPPSLEASPATVAASIPYYTETLEARDKTAQQQRNLPPPTLAQSSPGFQVHTPLPPPSGHLMQGVQPPKAPTGARPARPMDQTQSQELPALPPFKSPASSFVKHPAFLGGVVGFFLLLGIWMLLPNPSKQKDGADGGAKSPARGQFPRVFPRLPEPGKRPNDGRPTRRERRAAPRPAPGPAAPTPPVGPGKVSAQEMVQMRITTDPPGANIYLKTNGRNVGKVGVTPYTVNVPKGTYTRVFIRKPGYAMKVIPWPANSNSNNTIKLIPID